MIKQSRWPQYYCQLFKDWLYAWSYLSFIPSNSLLSPSCVFWMHPLTRSIHYAQGRPCLYVFVYGALWFHGSITIIDRRWFTDNPWLCFHIGPHEERRWLWASRVLESELHVALDSHLFLCIRPLTLCPFFLSLLLYLKNLWPRNGSLQIWFHFADRAQIWLHTVQNVIFSGEVCNYIFFLVPQNTF